jgi:8-oxo-dGTP diphosphatase
MSKRQWVKLVVYVFLEKDGKILLGKRKGVFGEGHYSMPAGHIDKGETVAECGKRELFEETGIKTDKLEFVGVRLLKPYKLNNIDADPYVAFAFMAKDWRGNPKNMEPERNYGWEWHALDKLPEPIFPPVLELVECLKKSKKFID